MPSVKGYRKSRLMTGRGPNSDMSSVSSDHSSRSASLSGPVRLSFRVEHLASFPLGTGDRLVSPKERLEKAKELIAKGEPWTKEMDLTATDKELALLDCETQEVIERYFLSNIDTIQDVSDDPHLKSVLIFSTTQTPEKYAAVHLFQCDKVPADVIAPEVYKLVLQEKSPKINGKIHGVAVLPPPPDQPAPLPPQGAATYTTAVSQKDVMSRPSMSTTKITQGEKYGDMSSPELMEAYINRDVQILNHCIDDIEELVYRVKQIAEAWKQLDLKYYKQKKSKDRMKHQADAIEARSPSKEEFIDAFQKCKFAFTLLGKLKPHIQNPSAAELVHYLIMPLSLLVRCTRGPQEASGVTYPLMTSESVELLRSTLTENETELWKSLGPAWTLSRSSPHWSKTSAEVYEPKFKSGWVAPEIVGSGRSVPAGLPAAVAASAAARMENSRMKVEETKTTTVVTSAKYRRPSDEKTSAPSSPSKDAIFKRVNAVYSFNGQNPKELSVNQGEELMILDDSRQWWCVRNSKGAVGFVPNTILQKDSYSSSNKSQTSPKVTAPLTPTHDRHKNSFSSDSSLPVFSNHSSSSLEENKPPSKPPSPQVNGVTNFQSMIQTRSTSLKKVEDVPDGRPPVENKRLSSADLLNNELKTKISSERVLSPSSRENSQESAIILNKGSTARDVQDWMKLKRFSERAMAAVQSFSAEQLGDMTRNDISHLVGDSEGGKLYKQLNIEKSGGYWHDLVVHRGVSELEAVMSRRKNLSEGDGPGADGYPGGIRNIVKEAQSDRQNTWFERKPTKRGSLENLHKELEKEQRTALTRQPQYDLRHKTEPPSPTKAGGPPVAPKPRSSFSGTVAPYPVPPPPPNPPGFSQYVGVPPAPVMHDIKVDDLLREHQQQQEKLKEQQRQLSDLLAQQQQKDQLNRHEESRVRLEQQVKDQEAMLKLMREQQLHQQQQQLRGPTMAANVGIPPQPTYVSYVPVPAYPGMAPLAGVQRLPAAQPIYTIPQMYGAMPYQPQ